MMGPGVMIGGAVGVFVVEKFWISKHAFAYSELQRRGIVMGIRSRIIGS